MVRQGVDSVLRPFNHILTTGVSFAVSYSKSRYYKVQELQKLAAVGGLIF